MLKLQHKGKEKLKEDFDVVRILKTLADLRVMFRYYRFRHSDLMIEVNSSRKNVINLDDDEWEHELER